MARHSDYSIDSGGLVRASFEPPGAHLVFGPAVAARPTVLRQSKDINTPFPTNFRAFPRQRDHRAVEQETQTGLLVSRFGCPYGGLSSRSSIAQSSDPNVRAGPNYDSRAPRQIVGPTVFVPTYTRPPPSAEWAQPPKRSITPPSPSDELPPPSLAELTSLEYAQAISSFVSDFWKPRPGVQLSDGWEEPPPLPPRIPPRSPLDFSALDALGDRPFSLWGSKTIIYPEEVLFQGPPEVLPYSDPIRQHLEEHVPSYLQMSVETKAVGGIQASESLLPYALDPSHSPLAHEGLEYVSSSMSAKSFDDFAWPTDIRVQRSEHQGLQNLTMQEPSGMPLVNVSGPSSNGSISCVDQGSKVQDHQHECREQAPSAPSNFETPQFLHFDPTSIRDNQHLRAHSQAFIPATQDTIRQLNNCVVRHDISAQSVKSFPSGIEGRQQCSSISRSRSHTSSRARAPSTCLPAPSEWSAYIKSADEASIACAWRDCAFRATGVTAAQIHLRHHIIANRPSLKCPHGCKNFRDFSSARYLQTHIEDQHQVLAPECKACGKAFRTERAVINHWALAHAT